MESSIQVGVVGPTVWVKVQGRGSFLNSGNFKEFAKEMVNRGYRDFVIDLENCVMMDSTFMGTMAGVALRLREIGHGQVHVVHCGQRSHDLLSGLGLDQIFSIEFNGQISPSCQSLPESDRGTIPEKEKGKEQRTMLAAHEALCEVAPENVTRFKDVLDYLKQDLQREPTSN